MSLSASPVFVRALTFEQADAIVDALEGDAHRRECDARRRANGGPRLAPYRAAQRARAAQARALAASIRDDRLSAALSPEPLAECSCCSGVRCSRRVA